MCTKIHQIKSFFFFFLDVLGTRLKSSKNALLVDRQFAKLPYPSQNECAQTFGCRTFEPVLLTYFPDFQKSLPLNAACRPLQTQYLDPFFSAFGATIEPPGLCVVSKCGRGVLSSQNQSQVFYPGTYIGHETRWPRRDSCYGVHVMPCVYRSSNAEDTKQRVNERGQLDLSHQFEKKHRPHREKLSKKCSKNVFSAPLHRKNMPTTTKPGSNRPLLDPCMHMLVYSPTFI